MFWDKDRASAAGSFAGSTAEAVKMQALCGGCPGQDFGKCRRNRIGTFEEITLPEHQQTTRLNDEALMTVTYLCLPYMEKGSHIIQMASASAFVPQPGFAVYAASKAYVLSFSRALRSEVRKKGITVTCVCPGPVDTAFFEGAEKYHKMPLFKKKSMADPKPVVEKAVYDAACGRALSIYGWSMKALFLACKILPHRLIIDLTAIFFKP